MFKKETPKRTRKALNVLEASLVRIRQSEEEGLKEKSTFYFTENSKLQILNMVTSLEALSKLIPDLTWSQPLKTCCSFVAVYYVMLHSAW